MRGADLRHLLHPPERAQDQPDLHAPHRGTASDSRLGRRLAELPDNHPSSARFDAAPPDHRWRLTDAEHADRVADVRRRITEARAAGLETHAQHTLDVRREIWSDERDAVHDDIVTEIYAAAASVPCEGRAILAGGLPGAGKTTALRQEPGMDVSRYLIINPDDIKERLARRGLIPQLPGLSPMESSDLAHEEASHIAKRLANRAETDRRNIIWDITMSSASSIGGRADSLRAAGYRQLDGMFVHVPIEVSVTRADLRHRSEHDRYLGGGGLGGRCIPADSIRAYSDSFWGSVNRRNFEALKTRLDGWRSYDNSVTGRPPELIDARDHRQRDQREQA